MDLFDDLRLSLHAKMIHPYRNKKMIVGILPCDEETNLDDINYG